MTEPQPERTSPHVTLPRLVATLALFVATLGLVLPYGAVSAMPTNVLEWVISAGALIVAAGLAWDLVTLTHNPEEPRRPLPFMCATGIWAMQTTYLVILPFLSPHDPLGDFLNLEAKIGWMWALGNSLQSFGWVILAGLGWRLLVNRNKVISEAHHEQ